MQDQPHSGLTELEQRVVADVLGGAVADLEGGSIRSEVVAGLVSGWPSDGRSDGVSSPVRIRRGTIDGIIDFEGAVVSRPLILTSVTVQGDKQRGSVNLRDARFRRLALQSCRLNGPIVADRASIGGGVFIGGGAVNGALQLRGARLGGALAIEGADVGDRAQAILANGVSVEGPVVLRRTTCHGVVALARATLNAGLHADGLRLRSHQDSSQLLLESATVRGDVLLDGASLDAGAVLTNAAVNGRVSACGAKMDENGLAADGCAVGQSFALDRAMIAGTVSLDGAEISGRLSGEDLAIEGGEVAITARVARFGGDVALPRLRAVGEIRMPGARVMGQVRLTEARIFGSDLAIRADGLRAEGGWFMSRATVIGRFRCPASEFGNQFRLTGTTVKVDQGCAVLASGCRFRRDVEFDREFNTIGAVVFDQSEISGTLDLRASRIKSGAIARGLSEHRSASAAAASSRSVAAVTEDGDLGVDYDESAISLVDARIGRLRLPARADQRPRGRVDFSRAEVGSLEDWAAAWPAAAARSITLDGRDVDHYVLDGFQYHHLMNPAGVRSDAMGRHHRVGQARIAWLESQAPQDVAVNFKPQPWQALAQRLSEQGYHQSAREVIVGQRRRGRNAATVGWVERWQSRFLDWFALYGYSPWRTVAWMVATVVLFATVWGWAGQMCSDVGCHDETVLIQTARDGYSPDGLARGYPDFHALAYSLDVFIPLVSLGYEDHWRFNARFGPIAEVPLPDASAVLELLLGGEPDGLVMNVTITVGSVLFALTLLERLIGLLLTSLAITGFTGLLRPRE